MTIKEALDGGLFEEGKTTVLMRTLIDIFPFLGEEEHNLDRERLMIKEWRKNNA